MKCAAVQSGQSREKKKKMSPSSRRLGGLVDTYLRKKLPRDIHPAITAVRDEGEATTTFLKPPDDEPQATSSNAVVVVGPQGDVVPAQAALDDDDEDYDVSLEEIYRDAKREKKSFELAMEAYESTTTGSKFKTEVTDKSVHTWDDVLTEVQLAADTYYDASGMWGKIQKGLRSFGRNSKAFEAWAMLLPSGSGYFSVLCGGLKLIFGAAARLQDLRSDICDALAEIPILLKCTNMALGIFKRSKDLHQASAALYSAIIAALHHIVVWYREKAMKTLFKSILKQDSYAKQLDDLLLSIRQQADRFEHTVRLHSYEQIVNTSQLVQAQGIQQGENHKVLVGYLDKSSNEFRDFRGELQSRAGDLQGEFRQLKSQVAYLGNILAEFLNSDSRMDSRTQDIRGPHLPIRRAKSESKLIRDIPGVQDALMLAFEYDSSVIQIDIAASLRGVWQISRTDQDRLVTAMHSPKLQRWITETTSSALFLNFNAPPNQNSTSFIAAKLADSIQASALKDQHYNISPVLVLSFFCGSHTSPDDFDFGVGGMMRSLISQLLLAYPGFGLHVVRQIQAANLVSISDLCKIFYLLIGQLPRHRMVFCILDSVTFFEENKSLREESEIVMRELMEVVRWTVEYGCCFKLLLTSPWKSRVLYRHLIEPEKDSVWLPVNVPSQGGFTRGKWERSVGRDMDRLRIYSS
ncbi:hypothetical protein TWF730_001820 [Orbilia blumenaviensis]|uniref:DUF7708 domain-containing protein n=1 Tax=Orbilia blumenaviensis TaxID=1796055 RepID=A0AAV9UDK8_9PEZI